MRKAGSFFNPGADIDLKENGAVAEPDAGRICLELFLLLR
jgi:hypothetical protein